MAENSKPSSYVQGHSCCTTATHERRTAEADAAFLLPHIKKTDHILDVGCGPGSITIGLAEHASEGATIGIDISIEVLEKAKVLAAKANMPTDGPGSVLFEEGNILETLAYPDDTFDIVYSSQVFGHLQPSPELPLRALAEIRRVLKPGGILATRDSAASHFYPSSFDLDRLWSQNLARALSKGASDAEPIGRSMPALFRKAGFDADGGKVHVGAGTSVFSGLDTRKFLAWRATGQLKEGDAFRESWSNAGITEDEIEETLVAVECWAETEDAWFVILQTEMLAWK